MQKFILHFSLLTFILLQISFANAQEVVTDLKYNSALIYEKPQKYLRSTDTLQLPFMDDFSYSQLAPDHKYPDQSLWMDRDVFVNTTYPVLPPSIGVATFDGLNEFGIPYDTSGAVQINPADSLTSLPIHLETVTPADSVYFSFFYEKMGIGDFPNVGDKLILEFKKLDGTWHEQWEMDGDASMPTLIKFRQIMILITDNNYFFNNFQFRFRNYATTSGNNDHWHIDYVRLNSGRNYTDTLLQDVTAVYTPGTILKNYEFMPWTQFKNNQSDELVANFPFVIRNNNDLTINTANQYSADEQFTATNVFTSGVNAINFSPSSVLTQPEATFTITVTPPGDSALLIIDCKATATPDINRRNDSAYRVQPFYNYFSHDDGSAEKAYGLNVAGGKLAVKYHCNVPDTLRAIQIHFAHVNLDVSDKLFSIMVWKSLAPTVQLYEQDFLHPTYIDSINGFATYVLDTPKAISDTFYVGMLQSYPVYYYVGLDRNTDSHLNNYYNVTGTWNQSSFPGSLMIRPVVGAKLPVVSAAPKISERNISVHLYPNPSSDVIHIDVLNSLAAEIYITDMAGKIVHHSEGVYENLFVGNLDAGMYLLTVRDKKTKQSTTTRFIKL
ncbi:MAG: T9SS type A sorting domain-containing protein [Bacteroidota bacterium]